MQCTLTLLHNWHSENVLLLLIYAQFNALPDDCFLELKHVAGISGTKRCVYVCVCV
jgi:hypothetical protein